MSAEDRKNMHYATIEECTVGMKSIMWKSIVTMVVIVLVIWLTVTIHFSLVLYSHWQNAPLSKEDGGTGED